MKIITVIRVHGYMKNLAVDAPFGTNAAKTVVKTENQDELINNIIKDNPNAMINVETIYDDKIGLLFDITYLQVDDDYNVNGDGDDDDDDDTDPLGDNDIIRSILGNKRYK